MPGTHAQVLGVELRTCDPRLGERAQEHPWHPVAHQPRPWPAPGQWETLLQERWTVFLRGVPEVDLHIHMHKSKNLQSHSFRGSNNWFWRLELGILVIKSWIRKVLGIEKPSIAADREGLCSVAAHHGQQLVEAEVICHVRHSSFPWRSLHPAWAEPQLVLSSWSYLNHGVTFSGWGGGDLILHPLWKRSYTIKEHALCGQFNLQELWDCDASPLPRAAFCF